MPKTDSDGNDIAGVRLLDVTVPLATYTGWALRAGAQANDGCEVSDSTHPVCEDEGPSARRSGDPRLSIEERVFALLRVRYDAVKKAIRRHGREALDAA